MTTATASNAAGTGGVAATGTGEAAATGPGGATTTGGGARPSSWAALRGFISTTLEQKPEFAARGNAGGGSEGGGGLGRGEMEVDVL